MKFGLTPTQEHMLREHSKHYSKEHIIMMKKAMAKGKDFSFAHNMAIRKEIRQ